MIKQRLDKKDEESEEQVKGFGRGDLVTVFNSFGALSLREKICPTSQGGFGVATIVNCH